MIRKNFGRWILPAFALATILLWFIIFPLTPPFDWNDILFEGVLTFAICIGYYFLLRLRVFALTVGWIFFAFVLWIDLLGDFTGKPIVGNSAIPFMLQVISLIFMVVGMRVFVRRRADENAQLQKASESLRRQLEHLQSIYKIADAVNRSRALDEIFQAALDSLESALQVSRAAILLFDSDGVMRFQAWRHLSDAYRAAAEGHSPWAPDAPNPQPIFIADVAHDTTLGNLQRVILAEGIRALGFIPLTHQGKLLGTFMLSYDQPRALNEPELQLAQTLASHVAFAIARARADAALQKSQTQYQDLFENATDMIFTFDLAGNFTSVNRVIIATFDFSRAEFLTRNIADLLTPESLARALPMLEKSIAEKSNLDELQPWEFDAVTRAGKIVTLEVRTRFIWEDGQITGIQGIARDVTERKHAEDALLRRDAILESVSFAAEQFLKAEAWEQSIQSVLARLGEAAAVSRVCIYENYFAPDGDRCANLRYEWTAPGIMPQINNPACQGASYRHSGFERWTERFLRGEIVAGNVREFPAIERANLGAEDIQSTVVAPILVNLTWWGLIGFDDCLRERAWSPAEIDALKTAADILGGAVEREQQDRALQDHTRHLAILNKITQAAMSATDLDDLMQTLADRMGELFNADGLRITLWDEATQRTIPAAAYGALRDIFKTMIPAPGETTMTASILRGEHALVIEDELETPLNSQRISAQFQAPSVLGLPLIAGAQKLGAAIVTFDQPHHFTADEIARGEQAAAQVALAIAKMQLVAQSQERLAHITALHKIDLAITSKLTLAERFDILLEHTLEQMRADLCMVWLIDSEIHQLKIIAQRGVGTMDLSRQLKLKIGEGAAGWIAKQNEPLAIPDVTQDARWVRMDAPECKEIQSYLGAPLCVENRVIGILDMAMWTHREFSREEIDFFATLASQAAIAIENARLFEQAQQRAREFTALYETARDLAAQQNLPTLLQTICERAAGLLKASSGGIYLYDTAHRDLELVATVGMAGELGSRLNLGEGMAGRVAETRQSLIVDDYSAWLHRASQYAAIPFAAIVQVPILYGGELIGVLAVNELRESKRQFTETDARLLALFAAPAASAVHNARLLEQMTSRTEHLAALNRVARAVNASFLPDEVLEAIYRETIQVLPTDAFFIALYDPEKMELDFRIRMDQGKREPPMRRPLGNTLTAYIIITKKPLLVRDWEKEKEHLPQVNTWGTMQMPAAWLGVPICAGDRVLGAISVQCYRPNTYGLEEQQLLSTIADQTAIALENVRLFEEIRAHAKQLESMYQVGKALNSKLDTEAILETVTDEAIRVAGATHGCLSIVDREANCFYYRALRGFSPEQFQKSHAIRMTLDQGLNGRAYHSQQIVLVDDVSKSPDYYAFIPESRSELVVPIIRGGQVLGNIDLQSPQLGAFRRVDLALLRALADQAGAALENARLFEETRRRALERSIVSDVLRALNAALDVRQAFPAIVKGMRELTDCDRVSLMLLDETNENFVLAALDSPRAELSQGTRLPVNATAAATDILAARVHLTPDLTAETGFQAEAILDQAGYRACINLPLIAGEWVIGSLNLASRHAGGFTRAQLPPLLLIADAVAIAIENMHLFEAEQARREELTALYNLSRDLADLNEYEAIMNLIVLRAVETIRLTFARIAICDGDTFVIRAACLAHTLEDQLEIGQREPFARHPFCARLLNESAPQILRVTDPRLSEAERAALFLGMTKTLCLVPLRVGARALGFLMLGESRDEQREPFSDDKIRLARSIGDQAASALHRADLFNQIENAFLQTVLALAQAMDAKDTYTANHAQRLADMSVAIGRELGLSPRELEELRYGATLHDVGKIGVPDAILLKPTRLTNAEWQKMRRHPVIGEQILAPVPRLVNAARIVRHHHERYDGAGYPDGLAGEAIPLGARILTVVDAYSAIVDKRAYKKPRPHKVAIAELKRYAGAQFDPRIVEIFLRLYQDSPELELPVP